jgi:hypothetical protein
VTGGIVERYLESWTAHGWDTFAAFPADGFTLVGSYGDTYPSPVLLGNVAPAGTACFEEERWCT